DGGGTWADNATAERREAGLPVAREGSCLASVASRVTARHVSRLDVSGRSANPLVRGVGSDEGEKRKKNPDAKRAGRKETGLFDMVNRKRRGRRIGQRLERHRVSGNALVSRPSARLGVPVSALAQQALELGPHRGCDVAALERIGDVGSEKAHLRSAIEAPAVELQAVERLRQGGLDRGAGGGN